MALRCRLNVATASIATLVVLVPAFAAAQSVRGTAVERAGGAPVPGVVMLLLDSAGLVSARSLTNEAGRYRLTAPGAGNYRVRTLRIGYRPLVSLPFELHDQQELEQTLVLATVAMALDTVRVVARSACRVMSDSAGTVAAVWEQARTALTAAYLTAGSRTIRAATLRFQRTLDPSATRTISGWSAADTNYVSKPWRSRSADSLRRFGYTHPEADGSRTYHAPDLDVLLSNEFVEDHCFRLTASLDDRELIGVAFEPTRDRSGIPDIRGTLWLNRASAELRRLEFGYVNTGARGIEQAGGAMEFARMASGVWAISRWNIRMPMLEERQMPYQGIPGAPPTTELRLRAWRVEGGELSLVTRGEDTLWSRTTVIAGAPPPQIASPVESTPIPVRDSAVVLGSVDVRAARPMLTEFEERRLGGMGHFLGRAELAKQEARALPDVLTQFPGVRIARSDGKALLTNGRGMVTSLNERRPVGRYERAPERACYADVYVDGSMMYGGRRDETLFDLNAIRPAVIEGIEYYASPATTPVKYSRQGAACGTLLIWTRKPERRD